jgi:hypothetical protein
MRRPCRIGGGQGEDRFDGVNPPDLRARDSTRARRETAGLKTQRFRIIIIGVAVYWPLSGDARLAR